jgi:murein DD-endopeptidase MepM/ murein hydrolase activator NlpD
MTAPFAPLPPGQTLRLAWPTPNRALFDAPDRFFARTRINPDYGRPGWTRDCGKRFHRGCDIAPVAVSPTGQTATVTFTDCATGRDFTSQEPTFVPRDEVYCVYRGVVAGVVTDESLSEFGRHIVVEHRWPRSRERFYTLYAHLSQTLVEAGTTIPAGHRIGHMGQTSSRADARNWLRIAPHLHFEVWTAHKQPFDPVEFLRRFL